MPVHQIWTPGPWGPDMGRALDSEEIEAMQATRLAEQQAAMEQPPIEPLPVTGVVVTGVITDEVQPPAPADTLPVVAPTPATSKAKASATAPAGVESEP